MTNPIDATRAHWSKPLVRPPRTRWWESQKVVRHINRNLCGVDVPGTDGADIEILRRMGPFDNAISVGCGNAYHEIMLLRAGVVREFDVFELSPPRAELAREWAHRYEVQERLNVHLQDAFATDKTYELVYWKDSLHHMFDSYAAVRWSRDILRRGGVFFMSEFVGPTRMQYTDRQLDLAERARGALPESYRIHPQGGHQVPVRPKRPTIQGMIEADPSECADSGNIIPAAEEAFSDLSITKAGGIVYMLALKDILWNFAEDDPLLETMLLADDLCVEAGESPYAIAWARKPD